MEKKNNDNFRMLFEQAPLGYQSLDIDGNFLAVNQKWLDTFGYERNEVIGKWFGNFLTPEYKEAFKKNFKKFKDQGHIHSEFEMVHKNGDVLFIAFEGQIGHNEDGNFKQTHCILEDITEKKKNETLLKESEEKFRNFFETSIVGKSMTSISGEIHVNKAFCNMLGYSEDELKNKKWQEITLPEDIEINQKEIDPLIKGEKSSIRFIKRYLHKNGSVVWADVSSSIYKDLQNRPSYFITTVIDITEQKLAEHKLKELLTRHKTFIDTVPDIIMEVDRNKVYTWANKAGYEFFGEDVIGKEASHFFEGNQDTYDSVEPLFKGDEEIIYLESYQKRKDREVRLLAWWCKVYKDSEGNAVGAISSARDITDIKQAEIELNKKIAELEETNSVMVGRELRMIELKEEINRLLKETGKPEKY